MLTDSGHTVAGEGIFERLSELWRFFSQAGDDGEQGRTGGPSGMSGRTEEVAAQSQDATLAASTMSRGSWRPHPPSLIGRVDKRHWASGSGVPTTILQACRSMGLAWEAVHWATSGAAVRKIQETLQADRHCLRMREAARGQPNAWRRDRARW